MKLIGTLSKHGNTITDLSFHEQQTHIITTCSYDNNIHIWDIRYVKHTKILREISMPTCKIRLTTFIISLILFVLYSCPKQPTVSLSSMEWTTRVSDRSCNAVILILKLGSFFSEKKHFYNIGYLCANILNLTRIWTIL